MPAASTVLRGVDRAAFAVALATRLRSHGVAVGFTAIEDLVRALAAAPPRDRSELYWTARVCFVRRESELSAFDAVFAAVFADAVLEVDPAARRRRADPAVGEKYASVPEHLGGEDDGAGLPWITLPPAIGAAEDTDAAVSIPERLPAALVAGAQTPFEQLSAREMQLLGSWLEQAAATWPERRTRRESVSATGHRIALRPTIARARRTGWEPVELVRVRPLDRRRRVVLLCDVSQSMQAQAVAYLHLMRALALTADAEVFAFATSLTRLTSVLAHRSPDAAIEVANTKVVDRFGGTRIATNLRSLLASHHSGALRGAIVIIGSDGWDSDPPEQLAAAMARLRRRAHRVIWMNPRVSAPAFEPSVASMAAALPYCDELLAADCFASLANVIQRIGTPGPRGRVPRAGVPGWPVSSTGSRGWRDGTARR